MEKCGKRVTHTVRVVGKKRMGFVCPAHLERTKKICVQINEKLHVERYDGDEMFCQLPAGAAGPESEKSFSIFEPRVTLKGEL